MKSKVQSKITLSNLRCENTYDFIKQHIQNNPREIVFDNIIFNCEISELFTKLNNVRKIEFIQCNFIKKQKMSNAKIKCELYFKECNFLQIIYIENVDFLKKVIFDTVKFKKKFHASFSTFKTHVEFVGITFSEKLNILKCFFKDILLVDKVSFKDDMSMAYSSFQGLVEFTDCCFDKISDFTGSKFYDFLNFDKIRFYNFVRFENVFFNNNLNMQNINSEYIIILFGIISGNNSNVIVSKLNIKNDDLMQTAYEYQKINPEDSNEIKTCLYVLRSSYCYLKHHCLNNSNYLDASEYKTYEFRAKELEFENTKKLDLKTRIDKYVLKLNRITSGYHTNLLLILNVTLTIIGLYYLVRLIFESYLFNCNLSCMINYLYDTKLIIILMFMLTVCFKYCKTIANCILIITAIVGFFKEPVFITPLIGIASFDSQNYYLNKAIRKLGNKENKLLKLELSNIELVSNKENLLSNMTIIKDNRQILSKYSLLSKAVIIDNIVNIISIIYQLSIAFCVYSIVKTARKYKN